MKYFLATLILASVTAAVAAADFDSCASDAAKRRDACLLDATKNGTSDENCYLTYENAWEVCGSLYTQRRASDGNRVKHES